MVTVEKYAAKVVDKVKDHVGPLISKALSHIGTDTARVQRAEARGMNEP